MSFTNILNHVPDYKYFKTVDELKDSSRKLAKEHPDLVQLELIGKSRNGDEIEVLKIGNGAKKALLFACPHPNEPIGSMMLDFLTEELTVNDELRQEFDLTWYIIKCVDPDGTRLNEGWFKGPFTPANYARNFYRPASQEQVEWTFPIEYKNLKFNEPLPETQALMKLIEDVKPDFLYSLHNAGFGGAYFYMSEGCPEVYESLRRLVTDRQVALQLGEPEMPYAIKYSDAVYQMPSIKDTYDYFEKNTKLDLAKIIPGGASSFDYLKQINQDAFCLVCEVPYFYDPKIEDLSELKISRREAVLSSIEIGEEIYGFIGDILQEVEGLLKYESPFKNAVTSFYQMELNGNKAKRKWAETTKGLEGPVTVAQWFDNIIINKFYKMLTLGMTVRLLESEIEKRAGVNIEKLDELKEKSLRYFNQVSQKLESELNYQVIPIKKLVQIQLGSALEILKVRN